MQHLARHSSEHPGSNHIVQLVDNFEQNGPNGTHSCLVFEPLGPNIQNVIYDEFEDRRLPGQIAKKVSKEVLLGLSFCHKCAVGHGGTLSPTFRLSQLFTHDSIRFTHRKHCLHNPSNDTTFRR